MIGQIRELLHPLVMFLRSPVNFVFFSYRELSNKAFVSKRVKGIKHVAVGKKARIPEFCAFAGQVSIGDYTTLGIHAFLYGNIEIGKYCQIGSYVAMHSINHPINTLATYINRNLFEGQLAANLTSKPIRIGNDVWVGHGVIVLSGVTVGDGAILAAGTVVTRDVPPYTIVAGNPARPLRPRFSDAVINELLALKWWDKSEDELTVYKELFFSDLTKVDSIYEIVKKS